MPEKVNLNAAYICADAENLPFTDALFDYVYSFGVMHHAPDTQRCVEEAYRVLRPGGQALIMLYHRHSLNEAVHRLVRVPFEERDELCPVVRRFTVGEIRTMFAKFAHVEVHSDFVFGEGYGPLFRMTPLPLYRWLSRRVGWHLYDSRYTLTMPDPIFPGRVGLYASMLHYGFTGYRDFAREHAQFFERLRADEGPLSGRRVLDVGCGKSYWLSLLLAADGAQVVGVDTELVIPGRGIAKYRKMLRTNGVERTLRTASWDMLFSRGYYRELERCAGKPLPHEKVELHVYDGANLPSSAASVDLIVSHEVFEHIVDVPAVLAEMARVLRPEGKIYIYIHNFTSLSGGHHIAWKHPDAHPSCVVAPWDHLRARRHAEYSVMAERATRARISCDV